MTDFEFDWSGGSDVVLRSYGSVAVHDNAYGDVVIRQERGEPHNGDAWIALPLQDAELIAYAIIDKAAEIKAGPPEDRPEVRAPRLTLVAPRSDTRGTV
jgi:hypothetical protein